MFTTKERLKQKTPQGGINRKEFIEHLVDEYHTTTDIEAQEQVTANLANFCYDPINWEYLRSADALDVFIEIVSLPNERLQSHGIAGLCNICYDQLSYKFITTSSNFDKIRELLLKTNNKEIILNCLTLLYQLLTINSTSLPLKQLIASPVILKKITNIRESLKDDLRIKHIASLFLKDFGTRNEVVNLQANVPKDSNIYINQESV